MTMKRPVRLLSLAAATAGVAAATFVHAGGAATRSTGVAVATKFPAAGQLVVGAVVARRHPAPDAAKIKVMHYFRPDYGVQRVQEILAVGSRTGSDGQPWYHISVPMRPNGRLGWIPAADVALTPTVSQIVVNVRSKTIDVFRNGKHALHSVVAVGAPGMQTPLGHYYVAATFVPHKDPFYGVWAIETSAYSKLSEWPGGGVVGIHGTNEPWLLGKAVSHGCIRVSNKTASRLRHLAPIGTPIFIKR
jgi:lipoprotein-anchoring transpeptidase ErfK/SrfK